VLSAEQPGGTMAISEMYRTVIPASGHNIALESPAALAQA
jgi:hypothetical protein